MSADKVISAWKKKVFKPVYWLEGEEDFFIDEVVAFAEQNILPPSEAEFNLSVFYGKDAQWTDVINACRRYPMFAEKQVVLLKEAQQMKDIDKLEGYIANPLPSTILVVSYKGKTVDKRSKLAKLLKDHEVVTSAKLYENKIPGWTAAFITSKGLSIESKAQQLLIDHIGNDLSRIANEIEKLSLNLGIRKSITVEDVETFVGISKEYNISEFQNAIGAKDVPKALKIIQYFESNPKAVPIQMLLPSLYNFFSKILVVHTMADKSVNGIKPLFYFNAYLAAEAMKAVMNYSYQSTEQVIMLLHEYNLKTLGVNSTALSTGSLLKELTVKVISLTGNR
ncbi:DNA polymerase III subunit delta [soil metagenome]